jgi:predicted nucleotidyltransferase
MLDVFAVADLLIARAVNRYPDEIDLVAYYGSYAQGKAQAGSDLDIFYVPAESANPPVSRTVAIAGIMFDFWPIKWDVLEGMATGTIRGWALAPSLVYHAKALYRRSAQAVARLAALKQKVVELQQPAARPLMIGRALRAFREVLAHLGNLRLAAVGGGIADARHAGFQVILSAWECLALANQAFFDQGLRSILAQADRLHTKPAHFERLVVTVGTSDQVKEILEAAEELAYATRAVLRQFQQSLSMRRPVAAQFANAYPEIKDGLRKVIAAVKQQQPFEANIAAWYQQTDLCRMLAGLSSDINNHGDFSLYREFSTAYTTLGWPELIAHHPHDLTGLGEKAHLLDRAVRRWLQGHQVALQEYDSFEAFAATL